jgi:putative acetyltransferase
MIEIRPIRQDEIPVAKKLIYSVAHELFHEAQSLEESIAFYESRGQLHDLDNVQQTYFADGGIFLVLTDDEQLIGTGAIRRIDDRTCELKRLWLLFPYHGKGLGYRLLQELLAFARDRGYRRVRLETDRDAQSRAYQLYKRLGFYEITRYSDNTSDAALEMIL